MRTPHEAGLQIRAALKTVETLHVYDDPSAAMRPPAALVGAPRIKCEIGSAPSTATFFVFLAAAARDNALARLMELVPEITHALEFFVDNAVVEEDLEPVALEVNGTTTLPAYMITVDVDL